MCMYRSAFRKVQVVCSLSMNDSHYFKQYSAGPGSIQLRNIVKIEIGFFRNSVGTLIIWESPLFLKYRRNSVNTINRDFGEHLCGKKKLCLRMCCSTLSPSSIPLHLAAHISKACRRAPATGGQKLTSLLRIIVLSLSFSKSIQKWTIDSFLLLSIFERKKNLSMD